MSSDSVNDSNHSIISLPQDHEEAQEGNNTHIHVIHCRLSPDFNLQPCDICPSVELLEAQLDHDFQDIHFPKDLVKTYFRARRSRNLTHDRLASRLPVELVSRIFTLIDTSDDFFFTEHLRPRTCVCVPVLLSSICSRWREIAHTTPELWTNVYLDFQKHNFYLNITQQWLRRSGSLPLNLKIDPNFNPSYNVPSSLLAPLISLLRSHSSRWESLNLQDADDDMIYKLFHNLDDIPCSEFLDLNLTLFHNRKPILLHTPLRPRRFHSTNAVAMNAMPFQWDNLMYLDISTSILMDDILHVVEDAPKLQSLALFLRPIIITDSNRERSANPMIHRNLKSLRLTFLSGSTFTPDISIFQHLVLPSLQLLSCTIVDWSSPTVFTFNDVIVFFERSDLLPGSLETFQLLYLPSPVVDFDQDMLFSLNALTYLHMVIDSLSTLSDFLRRLSNDSIVFPHLETLKIAGRIYLHSGGWDLLCDFIVQQNSFIRATTRGLESVSPQQGTQNVSTPSHSIGFSRPLKYVGLTANQKDDGNMKRETFIRLRDAQREGPIELKIGFDERHCSDLLTESVIEKDGLLLFPDSGTILVSPRRGRLF